MKRDAFWNYFRIRSRQNKTAKCVICNNILSYRSTITNLKMHLKKRHFRCYQQMVKLSQRSLSVSDNEDTQDTSHSVKDNDDKQEPGNIIMHVDQSTGPTFEYVEDVPKETDDSVRGNEQCHDNPIKINNDNIYMQYDILDESEFKKGYNYETSPRRRRHSIKTSSSCWDNNIDSFTNYIASMLKMLPRQTVARFQVLVTQRLVNEQMKYF